MADEDMGWEGWVVLGAVMGAGGLGAFVLLMGGIGAIEDGGQGSRMILGPQPPALDLTRLAIGLGLAALLLFTAGWVMMTTDWSHPENGKPDQSAGFPTRNRG